MLTFCFLFVFEGKKWVNFLGKKEMKGKRRREKREKREREKRENLEREVSILPANSGPYIS